MFTYKITVSYFIHTEEIVNKATKKNPKVTRAQIGNKLRKLLLRCERQAMVHIL